MKRRILLLAVAVLALFAIVAAAPSPPHASAHASAQAQLSAEQLVPIDLAAVANTLDQAALEVTASIGASVPGAKRSGLVAVVLFEGVETAKVLRRAFPPARAVPLERSLGHEAC